jgi:hypothetical protein
MRVARENGWALRRSGDVGLLRALAYGECTSRNFDRRPGERVAADYSGRKFGPWRCVIIFVASAARDCL